MVIAIIAVLIALLLPAVQQAREAARRSECKNKLKQLGVALHNHHETFDRLPPGAASDVVPFGVSGGGWGSSWMVYILPYIDQSAIYNQWTFNGSSGYSNANNKPKVHMVKMQAFICPSSIVTDFASSGAGGGQAMVPHYSGIAGAVNGIIPGYTETRQSVGGHGTLGRSGTFFSQSKMGLQDLTDGSSNIIVIGETNAYMQDTTLARRTNWHPSQPYGWTMGNDTNVGERHFNCTTIRYKSNDVKNASAGNTGWTGNKTSEGIGDDCGANYPLSSYHVGGVHVLLGDGSVRFISDNMDFPTLAQLAIRDDGKPVGEF